MRVEELDLKFSKLMRRKSLRSRRAERELEELFEALSIELKNSTERACAAVDDMKAFVEASNKRIDAMLRGER